MRRESREAADAENEVTALHTLDGTCSGTPEGVGAQKSLDPGGFAKDSRWSWASVLGPKDSCVNPGAHYY
eukprot:1744639-Pyramimonas_sp.AAC.1